MEKFVKGTLITLMVLAVAGVASADYTSAITDLETLPGTVTNTVVADHVTWTFDWTAQLALLTPPGDRTITGATLIVNAEGVNNDGQYPEKHDVYLDGLFVGTLEYSAAANDSEFTLSSEALTKLADGKANMDILMFIDNPLLQASSKLNWSSLTVNYFTDVPEPPVTTVPAPGAIVLCGLGAGLVGWLRKRGMA